MSLSAYIYPSVDAVRPVMHGLFNLVQDETPRYTVFGSLAQQHLLTEIRENLVELQALVMSMRTQNYAGVSREMINLYAWEMDHVLGKLIHCFEHLAKHSVSVN